MVHCLIFGSGDLFCYFLCNLPTISMQLRGQSIILVFVFIFYVYIGDLLNHIFYVSCIPYFLKNCFITFCDLAV